MSKEIGLDVLSRSNFRVKSKSLYIKYAWGALKLKGGKSPDDIGYLKTPLFIDGGSHVELTTDMNGSFLMDFSKLMTAIEYCQNHEIEITEIMLCGNEDYLGIDVKEEVLGIRDKIKEKEII